MHLANAFSLSQGRQFMSFDAGMPSRKSLVHACTTGKGRSSQHHHSWRHKRCIDWSLMFHPPQTPAWICLAFLSWFSRKSVKWYGIIFRFKLTYYCILNIGSCLSCLFSRSYVAESLLLRYCVLCSILLFTKIGQSVFLYRLVNSTILWLCSNKLKEVKIKIDNTD